MNKRAVWKGIIQFGRISVPVKLYTAVDEKTVHFRLLHKKDKTPVKQEMVHPETGEVVPPEAIHHAYATEDGRMVILTDKELKALEPEASRTIELIQFLADNSSIDNRWYERPYFLGPDGDRESYLAMTEILGDGTEALARWVMRNKEYSGVLRLQGRYPVLITLRPVEEIVRLADLEIPAGREIDEKEFAMAEQLVAALTGDFEPAQYRDTYRERVMQLIQAKASGKIIPLKKGAPKKTTRDLKKALQGSLRAAEKRHYG